MKFLAVVSVLACFFAVCEAGVTKPKPPKAPMPTSCNDTVEAKLMKAQDDVKKIVDGFKMNVTKIQDSVDAVSKMGFCIVDYARKLALSNKVDITTDSAVMAFLSAYTGLFTKMGLGENIPSLEMTVEAKLISSGIMGNTIIQTSISQILVALMNPRANAAKCYADNAAAIEQDIKDYLAKFAAGMTIKQDATFTDFQKAIGAVMKDKTIKTWMGKVDACTKKTTSAEVITCFKATIPTDPTTYPIINKFPAAMMPFSAISTNLLSTFNSFDIKSLTLTRVNDYITCLKTTFIP